VCSFGLFSFLGQCHTAEPFMGKEYRSWGRTIGIEVLFLAHVDQLYEAAGAMRARVMPWPRGVDWVLSVRHDFDRDMGPEDVDDVLERHRSLGTSATWYWRARYVDPAGERDRRRTGRLRGGSRQATSADVSRGTAALARVAGAPDHEVALHTEKMWVAGDREKATVEAAIGQPVHGSSAHGDPQCFRYQGSPNILWAERAGLEYTEFLQHAHFHPHRAATLDRDGAISTTGLICVSHHESFDRSMKEGDTGREQITRAVSTYVRTRAMLQVLNHPDLNRDELFEMLGELPREGRLDWTATEAADWWRRTHVQANLSLETTVDGRIRLDSRNPIAGLMLEVRTAGGDLREFAIYLQPERPVVFKPEETPVLAGGDAAVPDEGFSLWERLRGGFGEAVNGYFAEGGRAPDDPAVKSTRATNTTLIEHRAELLTSLLESFDVAGGLHGRRVLVAGSGFGALAAYLKVVGGAAEIWAIDNRPEFTQAARDVVGDAVAGLRYETMDMRALVGIPDGSIDLVIANNALPYLAFEGDLAAAIGEFARVLAPGGRLIVHQANRWRWRDPFTRTPLVHMFGPRSAAFLARVFRGEHSQGRVQLIAPGKLRRLLRRDGFTNVRLARPGRPSAGQMSARFAGFFALVAERDDRVQG
jgi:SAM-dependent methyltransferase